MRDPRLSPDPALARRLDAAVDDYADMPPLTGPPSSSMSTYRGTTDRHAAARVGTADASTQAGSSALLSSRRAYWTNEQQQLQQSFERYHSHRQELLQLPYPTPPATERPPPVSATVPIHRVYILRCATCDTFLSDRGMRVSAVPARSRSTGMLVASLVARVIKQDLPKQRVADLLPSRRPSCCSSRISYSSAPTRHPQIRRRSGQTALLRSRSNALAIASRRQSTATAAARLSDVRSFPSTDESWLGQV